MTGTPHTPHTPYLDQPLVDHHCHGLVLRDLDRREFEALLNEAQGTSPLGTSVFDSMLGLAVRRYAAPVLGLEELVDADRYLAERRRLGHREVAARMMAAAGVADLLIDTGFVPEPLTSPQELAALAGDAAAHEIIRLESVAEELLVEDGVKDFDARLRNRLMTSGAVGAKSIAAYRVGLDLSASQPDQAHVARALDDLRPAPQGGYRIADPVLNSYLAWTAVDLEMPLQFHVGYGDSDVNLSDGDPLRLTAFLRATEDRGVPVLLLHNYPFHRHAAYLAQVFSHVFMDVGLAVHNTGALSRTVVAESLELVPFGKMLYSSDAFGLAELYLLGALLFRRGLSDLLAALVEDGELGTSDATRIGALIGVENARRVYRLPGPGGTSVPVTARRARP